MIKNLGWEVKDNKLTKIFLFRTFAESMVFVNEVAALAIDLNHHPDLYISKGEVIVSTSTHESGDTVTEKDWVLAEQVDTLSNQHTEAVSE